MNNVLDNFFVKINDISFENIDDLYSKRDIIKKKYEKLDFSEKQIYKWYFFYQLCLLKNPLKKSAWEFINNSSNDEEFCACYNEFLEKRRKIIDEESKIIEINVAI